MPMDFTVGVMDVTNKDNLPMLRRLVMTVVLCVMVGSVGWAQEAPPSAPPSTREALEQAELPPRDRAALAQSLLGIGEIAPPPAEPVEYALNEVKTFYISNSSEDEILTVNARLLGVGEHVLIWVDDRGDYTEADIQPLVEEFDRFIYPKVRGLWGSEATPGIDGDPRVFALFAYGLSGGVGAYYASDNSQPSEVVSTSNEHEMFVYNLWAYEPSFDSPEVYSTTAHEFQHMIRANINPNPDTWFNEGMSVFTEIYLGYPGADEITLNYLAMPFTQLNSWPEDGFSAPNYAGAGLFLTYLHDRYGLPAIQAVSASSADGLTSVDRVLRELGAPGVDEFFADWVVANITQRPDADDGRWGYQTFQPGRAFYRPITGDLPYTYEASVRPYAVDYFAVGDIGSDTLRVSLTLPQAARAVPTEAASGARMWYSNRGDNSAATLTRAFDLRGVSSAELSYRVWHWFESLWDFGYLMVSDDGGETWDILSTPNTTTENPHNTAYGAGYTGRSEQWLDETVSLDAYAGREILVRFAVITDDAVNQPGMVVDDIRLDAVGYASDFEGDGGGWQAEGWVWIDNVLPVTAYVQVIQLLDDGEVSVTRHVLNGGTGEWDTALDPAAERVFIAVSPVVPLTTEPLPYTIEVGAG